MATEHHDPAANRRGATTFAGIRPFFGLAASASQAALQCSATSMEFLGRRLRKDATLVDDLFAGLATGNVHAVYSDYCRDTFTDYAEMLSCGLDEAARLADRSRSMVRREVGAAVEDLAAQTVSP